MPGGKRSASGVLADGEVCPREHAGRHHAGSGKMNVILNVCGKGKGPGQMAGPFRVSLVSGEDQILPDL